MTMMTSGPETNDGEIAESILPVLIPAICDLHHSRFGTVVQPGEGRVFAFRSQAIRAQPLRYS
jgi:hypothetical protein